MIQAPDSQNSNLYLNVVHFFNTSVYKTFVAAWESCFPALVTNMRCCIVGIPTFPFIKDNWWSKHESLYKCSSFFQHQCLLDICGSLRQLFSCIGDEYVVINCWNTNISFYLKTTGGQNCGLYLNVVHFFNTSVN